MEEDDPDPRWKQALSKTAACQDASTIPKP
jgi:hypothetical protein